MKSSILINRYVSRCGQTIYFFVGDSITSQPVAISAVPTPPTVSVNGVAVTLGPACTYNSVNYVAFALPKPVLSTDKVTFTAPTAGWITTVSNGTVQAYPSINGVLNNSGSLEAAFVADQTSPRTMPLGINIASVQEQPYFTYSVPKNWLKKAGWGGVKSWSAGGLPMTWSGGPTLTTLFAAGGASNLVDGTGYPIIPGIWTLVYDEYSPSTPSVVKLTSNALPAPTITATVVNPGVLTNGVLVGIEVQYNVVPAANSPIDLELGLSVTPPSTGWSVQNPFLFGPNEVIDRSDPLAISDNIKRWLVSPTQKAPVTMRYIDSCLSWGGFSNITEPEDLPNTSAFTWCNIPGMAKSAQVIQIRPYDTSVSPNVYTKIYGTQQDSFGKYIPLPPNSQDLWLNMNGLTDTTTNTGWYIAEVVCSAPHGLVTGQQVNFPAEPGQTLTIQDSPTTTVPAGIGYMTPLVFVTSPTTFVYTAWSNAKTPGGIKNLASALNINATITWNCPDGGSFPFEFAAHMVSQFPNTNLWIPVPHAASDECVIEIAKRVRDNLVPGRKVYVEYTNEHWNNFAQMIYLRGVGGLQQFVSGAPGVTYNHMYVQRASQVHDIFYRIFNEPDVNGIAKRGNEILRLFGSFYDNPNLTADMISYANMNGIQMDAVAIAPYNDMPSSVGAIFDTWTMPMIHDFYRHHLKYDLYDQSIYPGHLSAIAKYLPVEGQTTKLELVGYEGGTEITIPSTTTNGLQLSVDSMYHPDMYDSELAMYQQMQNGGMSLCTLFFLGFYRHNYRIWPLVTWAGQKPGRGDGSNNGAINQFWSVNNKCNDLVNDSVKLQAFRDWIDSANNQLPRSKSWYPL